MQRRLLSRSLFPIDVLNSGELTLNNGAVLTNGLLQLTDGGGGEIRSAFYNTPLPVSTFATDFTFQLTNAVADGFTFTIQNDPKSVRALGYGGGGLGYQSIQNSVALKFDIYNNAGEGTDSIGVYTNGAAPTVPATDLTPSGLVLKSGDLFHAYLVYNGTVLTVTLTDTVTGVVSSNQFTVDIRSAVSGSSAYVGFTAGTGAYTAIQEITGWTYSAQ